MYKRISQNKKAQTATEYIIIVAVVIVIALVVVQIMGGFPGIGSGTSKKVTDYKLASTGEIGIDKYYFGNGSVLLTLKNNNYEILTVNNLSIRGITCVNTAPSLPRTLNPGQVENINCSNSAFLPSMNDDATPSLSAVYTNLATGASYTVSSSGSSLSNVTVEIPAVVFSAVGGNVTYSGNYTIHTFSANGTFNVTSGNSTVEVLVVAGGGGGGYFRGAGGAGGGMNYSSSYLAQGNINVVIGKGGRGGVHPGPEHGLQGENSVFGNLTAIGGLGGGDYNDNNNYGVGGVGLNGGGSGGNSGTAAGDTGLPGGTGTSYSINGSAFTYSGGGGGSTRDTTIGAGGINGGGAGGRYPDGDGILAQNGTANTGGGGGGSWYTDAAGAGGSGIVIIRYLT